MEATRQELKDKLFSDGVVSLPRGLKEYPFLAFCFGYEYLSPISKADMLSVMRDCGIIATDEVIERFWSKYIEHVKMSYGID